MNDRQFDGPGPIPAAQYTCLTRSTLVTQCPTGCFTLLPNEESRATVSDRKSDSAVPNKQSPRRAGLGRGLEALIPPVESPASAASITTINIADIAPNPRQPRTNLDPEELQVLADSIRMHGVIQPIVIKPSEPAGSYTLIAGERRWRASQLAGLLEIPAVVMDVSLQAQLELALVENVIRSDLSALEEAVAYRQLIDEFGLTQADVADRVGRSRVSITNTLRLLLLPDRVKDALDAGDITEGHARALLGLPSAVEQIAMLETVIRRGLSVRETETAVRSWVDRNSAASDPSPTRLRNEFSDSEQRLRRALSTNVAINRSAKGSGSIRIDFTTEDQLAEILDRIAGEALY